MSEMKSEAMFRELNRELGEVMTDAERWRSLLSCDRIRVLGHAQLGKPHQHLGLELWENYPSVDDNVQAQNREILTKFVDGIRSR